MEINKISEYIKNKRMGLAITREELSNKLFITKNTVSRWETGRDIPDTSHVRDLAKTLGVDVSELLNGEDGRKQIDIKDLIEYNKLVKKYKFNIHFKLILSLYTLSILTFLLYLVLEYAPFIHANYFIRLLIVILSSTFVIIGNKIYGDKYAKSIKSKKIVSKLSQITVFIYYIILIFSMVFFARNTSVDSYNIIPFKSIFEIFKSFNFYSIVINIFGNLLMFMPLEYFIIELFKVNKFSINLFVSFIIILLIELFQFIFKVGVFDVDDLILCTLGMMIFYLLYNKFINRKDVRSYIYGKH